MAKSGYVNFTQVKKLWKSLKKNVDNLKLNYNRFWARRRGLAIFGDHARKRWILLGNRVAQ
jgi:hypothetical protein